MRYWLTTTLWEEWYDEEDNMVRFSGGERATVSSHQEYATTMFYGLENDTRYDGGKK